MRNPLLAALLATLALSGCKDDTACTPEAVQARLGELAALSQSITATEPAKIGKLVELTPRIAELQQKAATAPGDEAVCKGLDEVLAELR